MTVGFKAINDSGNVLLDTNFKNYTLVSQGVLSLDLDNRIHNIATATLTVSGTAPIVAFNRLRLMIFKVERSGSNWTYTFVGLSSSELTNPNSFNYWVFDVGYSPSGDPMGLRLYNESGLLAYDSGVVQFPNVLGTATKPLSGADSSLTFAAGTNVAVVQIQLGWQIVSLGGGGGLEYYMLLAQGSGNTVFFDERLWYTGTNASVDSHFSQYYTNVPSAFLFLDIGTL